METRIRSNRGITIIELMTTVVIIGIVSSMAVPRFQTAWERIRIRGADRDMISTVRLARSMAITDKSLYGIYFDTDDLTVTLFKDIVNPGATTYESGDFVVRVDSLPTEYEYMWTDMTNNVLVFNPNGSASFVGGGNITSLAVTEKVVAILNHNILASTGRIQSYGAYY